MQDNRQMYDTGQMYDPNPMYDPRQMYGAKPMYDERQMYGRPMYEPPQKQQKQPRPQPPSITGARHEIIKHPQKFVRYKEGAKLYSMCQPKFEQMAHDANAVYKLDKMVLVNLELFDKYLETFRVIQDRRY